MQVTMQHLLFQTSAPASTPTRSLSDHPILPIVEEEEEEVVLQTGSTASEVSFTFS
jgi:hypothetical protein